MAQIIEEVVTVKFSKIVKSSDATGADTIVSKEILDGIEMMAEQLCGDTVIVEVTAPATPTGA